MLHVNIYIAKLATILYVAGFQNYLICMFGLSYPCYNWNQFLALSATLLSPMSCRLGFEIDDYVHE
jgi:hypothetical protein